MKNKGIECKKYNYALDKEVQILTTNKGLIKLSEDEQDFILYTYKPVLKPKGDEGSQVNVQEMLDKGKTQKEIVDAMEDNDEDNDGIDELYDYVQKKSKASCKVKNIKGFTYGGFSSRFWLLRKHINSMACSKMDTIPFYCWECITLE